jgi:putative transposase
VERTRGPTVSDPPCTFAGDLQANQSESREGMVGLFGAIVGALLAAVKPRASLVLENLALRQQLAVLRRTTSRPRLRPIDRAFWVVLRRVWSRWGEVLAIVQPATVIAWHRRRFRRFWAQKSRRSGRPALEGEVVALIERMAR